MMKGHGRDRLPVAPCPTPSLWPRYFSQPRPKSGIDAKPAVRLRPIAAIGPMTGSEQAGMGLAPLTAGFWRVDNFLSETGGVMGRWVAPQHVRTLGRSLPRSAFSLTECRGRAFLPPAVTGLWNGNDLLKAG